MKLSVVIPAYNEEEAIAGIIDRCLEAKSRILQRTGLDDLEVVVVNDGSADKTHSIAASYKEQGKIGLVSYDKNAGYGAAIKKGFDAAGGEYLGFLDADGTCDPNFFAELFNRLRLEGADVSLGSRMGPESQMPRVRRLGNLFYAWLLSFVSGRKITDTASGMRILKRSAIEKLYPLPDGMNFTPAMSAKAVMNEELKIVETPMPYKERIGRSKLSVLKDGWRFLKTILETAFFYRPLKIFVLGSAFLFVFCLVYAVPLAAYYLANHSIRESDIYRIITLVVAGSVGFNLLLAGLTADQMIRLLSGRELRSNFRPAAIFLAGVLLALGGILLNHETIREYFLYREIRVHWLYVVTGGFFVLIGAELMAGAFLQKLLWIYSGAFRRKKPWNS